MSHSDEPLARPRETPPNATRSRRVAAALAALLALSCSTHDRSATDSARATRSEADPVHGAAEALVSRLERTFFRPAPRQAPAGRPTPQQRQPIVGGTPAVPFALRDGAFVPQRRADDLHRALRPADVRVALDGSFTLREPASGLSLHVRNREHDNARAELARGVLVVGADSDRPVAYRSSVHGIEDFTLVASPDAPAATYRVDLGDGVAGLRVLGGVVEFLDERGVPRLRMTAPYAIDAADRTHPLDITVEGCAFDSSPIAPWGRPVQAPHARSCVVRVQWAPEGVTFPLLVDPGWVSTGKLVYDRERHTATRLADGKVLIAGGSATATAELFDPASGTFALTGSPSTHRDWASAALLPDGRVIVANGYGYPVNTKLSETYEPATGTWTTTPDVPTAGYLRASASLPDGRFVLAGDGNNAWQSETTAVDTFDPTTNTWTSAAPLTTARTMHTLTRLADGRLAAVGGYSTDRNATTSVELFDSATESWVEGPPLARPLTEHLAILLPDNRLAVYGRFTADIEILDATASAWTSPAITGAPSSLLTVSTLKLSKDTLFVRGVYPPDCSDAAIGSLAAGVYTFRLTWPTHLPREGFCTATELLSGDVLVAGGHASACNADGASTAEVYTEAEGRTGDACIATVSCGSLWSGASCVDGVCCDSDCTGPCQACTRALTGVADGTCAPVKSGADPHDDCTADPAESCGLDGLCDGHGACRTAPVGTACATQCSGGTLALSVCSDASVCVAQSTGGDCAGYACASATACRTTCSNDTHCAASNWCDTATSTCAADLGAAETCGRNAQCASGHCVDGVCCDSACSGLCEGCAAQKKGAGIDGECGPVRSGFDPDDDCPDDGATSCLRDGACDGARTCRLYAIGSLCSASQCIGNSAFGKVCDGSGACGSKMNDCTPYRCSTGLCPTSCATNSDCAIDFLCVGGGCVGKRAAGAGCGADLECVSNHCVDRVCCESPCSGQCEACAEPGAEGKCVAAAGDPRSGRAACAGAATTCGGTCNGGKRDGCVFPGGATECGGARCVADSLTTASTCDGAGECAPGATQGCGEYTCAAAGAHVACKTTCTTSADCRGGATCDTSGGTGVCNASGATCDGAYAVKSPSGTSTPCPGGYRCTAGQCVSACSLPTDCDQASGWACVAGACVRAEAGASDAGGDAPVADAVSEAPSAADPAPAATGAESSGGCGVAHGAPRGDDTRTAAFLAAFGLALARRRTVRQTCNLTRRTGTAS